MLRVQEKQKSNIYSPTLRTVRLYGKMGTMFGRVHKLAVETPAEAIRALCVTIKGFEAYLRDSEKHGIAFAVVVGKENIPATELHMKGSADVRIAPVISGRKNGGLTQILVGALLIAASVFTGGYAALAFMQTGLMSAGVAMVAGGVVQMLSPTPKGISNSESADNKPSYAFGGAVNTVARGNPIPILAGERIIGGAVISAGVYSEDI